MSYVIFDVCIGFSGDGKAIEWAKGMVWREVETTCVDTLPIYGKLITTIEGVSIYYDFGADNYFFVDSSLEKPLVDSNLYGDFNLEAISNQGLNGHD